LIVVTFVKVPTSARQFRHADAIGCFGLIMSVTTNSSTESISLSEQLPARHVMVSYSAYMEFIDKHTSFKVVILLPTILNFLIKTMTFFVKTLSVLLFCIYVNICFQQTKFLHFFIKYKTQSRAECQQIRSLIRAEQKLIFAASFTVWYNQKCRPITYNWADASA
jgi:hypothetical protein